MTYPQGFQGCQTMRQDPLNMPYEVWCANIAPKLKNIWKSLRKQGFFDNFFSILKVFWSFFNFGSILAQELNSFICKIKILIFWHPWGRVNSEVNVFSVHTATVRRRSCWLFFFDKIKYQMTHFFDFYNPFIIINPKFELTFCQK